MSVSLSRPSKGAVRNAILWVHLWLGLIIGLYFAVVGATGSILVFEEDLTSHQIMPERAFVAPPQPGAPLLPLSQIIAQLRAEFPQSRNAQFAFINPPANPGGAYLFRLTADRKTEATTVDPYTGKAIKRYPRIQTWLDWVEDLHVRLLLKMPGRIANGYGGLLAGLLVLSGLWLWWPRTLRQLKIRLSVKRGGPTHRLISDLHNVMGIYPFAVLLAVTLTGSVIVFYAPVQNVLVKFTGSARTARPPRLVAPPGAQRLPIDKLMSIAEQAAPNADYVFVLYPTAKNQVFYAYRRAHTGIWPDSRIYIDPYSGKLLQIGSDITDPTTKKLMRSASAIHFGRWGSWPVKIIYFIVGLMPLGLLITGVLMYLRKRKAKYASQKRRLTALT